MKKIISICLVVLALAVVVTLFTACGDKNDTTQDSTTAINSEELQSDEVVNNNVNIESSDAAGTGKTDSVSSDNTDSSKNNVSGNNSSQKPATGNKPAGSNKPSAQKPVVTTKPSSTKPSTQKPVVTTTASNSGGVQLATGDIDEGWF